MLNELGQAGLASSHAGAPARLPDAAPAGRAAALRPGGQAVADQGRLRDAPVYWVTCTGAAAFAAWDGDRLPSRAELADWPN